MKKILLVMLFMCSFAFADYQFVVENSTMVNTYFNIFNAISAIFQSDNYLDLLRLVFLLGGFFVFAGSVLKSFDGNASSNLIAPYGKYLAVGVALLTMAFSYKETMWVTTDNLPSFCSTASPTTGFAVEIPSVLGYVFTTTNTIGRGLTSMAETAFSIPNANGTASMTDSGGYLGSLKQTINVLSLNPNDVTLQGMTPVSESSDMMTLWSTFFSKCVYEVANNKGSDGEKVLNTMTSSKNIYDWVQNTYLPYSYDGSTKVAGDYLIELNGRTVTCQSYFGILEASTNEFKANFNCALPLAHGGVLELLTGTNVGGSNDLTQIAVQSGLLNALSASKSVTSIGISGANFANGKSRAEANQNNLASAQYMAEMLPFIQMTMRAILYAFFPFVFVVVMLPGGIKVLTQYAQTMIWIELWGPTAAVVNMFVNMQVIEKVGGKYNEAGLTYISSINMLSEANTIAGVGAMLYLTIPALTWLILKGSGQMLGNVAGGLTAKFAQNMMSETQAKDVAQLKASAKSGMSITNTINQLEQLEATNRTGQAIGFSNSGGMDKNLVTKGKIEEGKLRHDFSNVLSQGSDYVKNQSTSGEQKGATESGNVQGYNAGGGFGAANTQAQIQTETGLKTTVKNVNDAGGVSNVANVKSELENKNFNKDMSLNDGTTKQDFGNIGQKDAAVMSGTSSVVEQKGTGAYKDATVQEELTKVTSAENKKEYAGGSNENVANTEASINVKGFAKKGEIDKNTSNKDFANLGKKESADIKGTSNVVNEKGIDGFVASKEQQLRTESNTALEKKAVAGSNENVAKTDTDKNVADFKTNKKVFEQFSTNEVSTAQAENQKENIVKTLETKTGIEATGQDTKDFYKSEAGMTVEERKASMSKADLNNDKKVDSKEAAEYGKDMTEKSVSDQNSLKFKNRRLLENADNFAKSENKDVRDTYNKAYDKYKDQGEEVAKIAGAKAVQESIATKEQQMNAEEKSEYVDRMKEGNFTGVDKADAQVQKEAENITKTNKETESFVDISKEQNKAEKYLETKENFKDKGMGELEAQNATLFAYAKEGKSNSSYSEHVFDNNTKDIVKNRDKEMLDTAKAAGAVKGMKGISTKQDSENISKLEKRKEQVETTLKAFDKFKNDKGQLSPERQMNAQPLILERDKLNQRIENAKGYTEFRKSEAGQAIAMKAVKKLDNLVENMKTMNLAKEDANGNLMFSSSSNIDKDNLTMSQKISLRKEKGDADGRGISGVGQDGRRYEVVTDISNERITNFTSAKNGYSNTGSYNNDILYNVGQTEIGKDNAKTIATGVTGVNAIKETVATVGGGKFITNLFNKKDKKD